MNMMKMLWCRFRRCFGTFTILLVEESPETGLFRHLSEYVFTVRTSKNTRSMTVIFWFNMFKILSRFQKCSKKFRKISYFWDNWIWIGIVNLSLLRTGYFSSGANMLTSSPKNWHVNKWDFFQLTWLGTDQLIWYKSFDPDFNRVWARSACCLSKCSLKRNFLEIYLTTILESLIAEIQKLWGSSFLKKGSKYNLEFKNAAKNREFFFCFTDNCICIGIVKFSLLRTGYFSSVANVLRSSPKIWHVNMRDFF